ncbi:MAG: hypothetical protein QM673_12605 [Gordonia sp. (in: high G+C Gram-positive bacteria)]
MTATSRRRPSASRAIRLGTCAAALAFATTFAAPDIAAAAPATPATPQTLQPVAPRLRAVPFDQQLAEAIRILRTRGTDTLVQQAAEAVKTSIGQLSADDIAATLTRVLTTPFAATTPPAATGTGTPSGATDSPIDAAGVLAILKTLGIEPFSPSIAPLCAAPTADNPLGLVTAGAGAAPGPWPAKTEPIQALRPLQPLLNLLPGVKLPEKINLVEQGETAYAFVPAPTNTTPNNASTTGRNTNTNDTGQMRVAWFNTSTLQGGFADLTPVADPRLRTLLPLLGGVRLAPVKTGSGTVLSAIFGTSNSNGHTCYFLPAVGVVTAQ